MGFLTGPTAARSAVDVAQLVRERRPGHSLDAAFYTSREVYDLDVDGIFGTHWLFCATEAELAEPGDYVTIDIGRSSVILVRDDDEQVRAFHNVCRHRGSRLLSDACGAVGNLVCPYHQWTYRTDGELIFAENQPPDFDRGRFGLKPVPVRSLAGLVFVCLCDEPPTDFDEVAAVLEPYLSPYRLSEAKVAHQTDIVEDGNWKLVMENNRECHHCDVGHPELLSAYFPFNRSGADDVPPRMRAFFERFRQAGARLDALKASTSIPTQARRELDSRPTGFTVDHLPLDGAGISFSPRGEQLCRKLMGDIPAAAFGDLYVHFQPNAWLHFLSDHAVVFRVLPLTPDTTLVRSTWLVHRDAIESVDYDVPTLTAVWQATNDQDRAFVEKCQRGVSDPSYEPGPYGVTEDDVEAFVTWYVTRLRHHLGQEPARDGALDDTQDEAATLAVVR